VLHSKTCLLYSSNVSVLAAQYRIGAASNDMFIPDFFKDKRSVQDLKDRQSFQDLKGDIQRQHGDDLIALLFPSEGK
jgi:hypothetical protein